MIETKLALGSLDIADATALRSVAFPEFSGADLDSCAIHVTVYDGGEAVSTGRLYHNGKCVVIDGLCTLPDRRRRGYADLSLRLLLLKASTSAAEELFVYPPEYIAGIFSKFGFTPEGEGFRLIMSELKFPHKCEGCNG